MLQEFSAPELSAVANMQQVIFQQKDASAHYSREVCAFLHEQFPNRRICCHGTVERAPRSPDLKPCDFLWDNI